MKLRLESSDEPIMAQQPSVVCPGCGVRSKFATVGAWHTANGRAMLIGLANCSGENCKRMVVAFKHNSDLAYEVWPARETTLELDNVPDHVAQTLTEAAQCRNIGCYFAAAVMIRKAAEQVCDDLGAVKGMLGARIDALSKRAVLSPEMLEMFQLIQFLGNDAAHLALKDFDDVGEEEVGLAFDFIREIINAVYQHRALVTRMRTLQKPRVGSAPGEHTL